MADGNRHQQKNRERRDRDRLERSESESYEKQQLANLADRWKLHSMAREALLDGRLNLAMLQEMVSQGGEPGARVDVPGGDGRLPDIGAGVSSGLQGGAEANANESVIQRKTGKEKAQQDSPDWVRRVAATGVSGTASSYPYLEQIQRAFGAFDISELQAHMGPSAAGAAAAINARAYATGNSVAFQGSPDLHTAAHDAAHVVAVYLDRHYV